MGDFDLMNHLGTAALGLGITALFIFWWHFVNRPRGSKEFRTGHATVVSRRVDQKNPNYSGFSRWKYLVTFDVGPTRVELQVSEADYSRLQEGLTGQLEWRYEYLYSFVPDAH